MERDKIKSKVTADIIGMHLLSLFRDTRNTFMQMSTAIYYIITTPIGLILYKSVNHLICTLQVLTVLRPVILLKVLGLYI